MTRENQVGSLGVATDASSTSRPLASVGERSAALFLLLLLCADLAFISIHSIRFCTSYLKSPFHSIETDRGYPEVYQYLKWIWVVVLLTYACVSRRSLSCLAWGLVFTYLLCDDALSIHERVGKHLGGSIPWTPPFGLRTDDLGELAVSAAVGAVLLVVVSWAYAKGTLAFKKASQDMLLLMLALVFFGVGADMLHIAIRAGRTVNFLLGALEDGGEMLVASAIVWYVFRLSTRGADADSYLCDSVRAALKRCVSFRLRSFNTPGHAGR